MIRTIVTADKANLMLSLPDYFVGKKVEIIAFIVDETQKDDISKVNFIKTFSTIELDTKGYQFNRDEANER